MIYYDRREAGQMLAHQLVEYKKLTNAIVIGLPRGGVVVAAEVAKNLQIPLDIVCPRKVGAPMNPELAIGAVTHSGEGYFNQRLIQMLQVPQNYIAQEAAKERQESLRRFTEYRKGRGELVLKDRVVLLVDDGIATGATMKAAIALVKNQGAQSIIAALPVGPKHTIHELEPMVAKVICLITPSDFEAVGQFYEDFFATSDQEVISILSEIKSN